MELYGNTHVRVLINISRIGSYFGRDPSLFTMFSSNTNMDVFLNTQWTEQYTKDKDGTLMFPNIDKVEKMRNSTVLKGQEIKPKEVYDFMLAYKASIQDYDTKLTNLNKALHELKASLLVKVQYYIDQNPDASVDKKNVMRALKNYLQEPDHRNIKQKQQDLTKALNENPDWAEGLISKRVRTAVESATVIIQEEELLIGLSP